MRSRPLVLVLAPVAALAGSLAVGGCAQPGDTDMERAAPGTTALPAPSEAAPTGEAVPEELPPAQPPADEPTATGVEHRVTYDWAIPSDQVTIPHPAEVPLPYLVAIYVGDHPEGDRPYQRVSFYFREGFPEYNLQYVRSIEGDATGEPISLQGNAFLRVGFVNAQAHGDSGESTVETAPKPTIGFTNLESYGLAGDFEGHLTYGLGLQVAPNSDQVLLVRAGEVEQPDRAGRSSFVVYVDVETGIF